MAAIIGVSKGTNLEDFKAARGYTKSTAEKVEEVGTAYKHLRYKDYSNGTEPLVTKDIIESSNRIGTKNQGGWYRQYAQGAETEITNRVDDVVRVTKWIGTPRGVLWEARQSALTALQTDLDRKKTDHTRVYGGLQGANQISQEGFWSKIGSGLSSVWQKMKDVGLGVVSSVALTAATLEQVAGAGTGLHTEPFITRAYLRTDSKGVLGQLLATVGIGTSMYTSGAKHALAGTEVPIPDENGLGGLTLKERRLEVGTRLKTLQVGLNPEDNKAYTNINGTRKSGPGKDLLGIGEKDFYLTGTGTVQDTFSYRGSLATKPVPEGDYVAKREVGEFTPTRPDYPPKIQKKDRIDKFAKVAETKRPLDRLLKSYGSNLATDTYGKSNVERVTKEGDTIKAKLLNGEDTLVSGSMGSAISQKLEAYYESTEVEATASVVLGSDLRKKSNYYLGEQESSKFAKTSDQIVDKALKLQSGDRSHDYLAEKGKDLEYPTKVQAQTSVETPSKFASRINQGNSRNLVPFYFQINNRYVEFEATLESYSDSYSGNWSDFQYIGRGEKFYVYENFDRTISFKFVALARNPESLKPLYHKLNRLASATAPYYNPDQNYFMNGPLSVITIGDLLKEQWGFFQNVNLSWQTDYLWEINAGVTGEKLGKGLNNSDWDSSKYIRVPHALDVDITFKPVHTFNVDIRNADYFAVYSEPDGEGIDLPDEWNGTPAPSGPVDKTPVDTPESSGANGHGNIDPQGGLVIDRVNGKG